MAGEQRHPGGTRRIGDPEGVGTVGAAGGSPALVGSIVVLDAMAGGATVDHIVMRWPASEVVVAVVVAGTVGRPAGVDAAAAEHAEASTNSTAPQRRKKRIHGHLTQSLSGQPVR